MVDASTTVVLVNIMAKLISNDTASKVLRLISGKEMTQGSGIPRDLGAADADPLLYALRVVTRSAAKEVQVYAPDAMPLMYDSNYDYFADTSLTRDTKNDNWISLAGTIATGNTVYAYFDKESASVKFTATEPTESEGEKPPFVIVGSSTETPAASGKYVVEQSWLGHFAIIDSADKMFPWKVWAGKAQATVAMPEPDTSLTLIKVYCGRVYETGCQKSSANGAYDYSFDELTDSTTQYTPGVIYQTVQLIEDYIVIAIKRGTSGSSDRIFKICAESTLDSGYTLVQRLAKVTPVEGGYTVEQIHMGDVTITEKHISPFTLAKLGAGIVMYMPEKSVVLNGGDFTGTKDGIGMSNVTDWYTVTGFLADGLNMYVIMNADEGGYGRPTGLQFAATAPTTDNEVITFNILKSTAYGLVNLINTAINVEIMRTDSNHEDSHCRSIESTTGGLLQSSANRTIGVRNFRSGTAPSGTIFNTEDSYGQGFAIREVDSDGKVDMKWLSDASLLAAIKSELLADQDWIDDLGIGGDSFDFWTWYDSVEDGDRFWKQGADEGTNYGSAIGNAQKDKIIDLDDLTLNSPSPAAGWNINSYVVIAGSLTVNGKILIFNQNGTVTWM